LEEQPSASAAAAVVLEHSLLWLDVVPALSSFALPFSVVPQTPVCLENQVDVFSITDLGCAELGELIRDANKIIDGVTAAAVNNALNGCQ
jgi:hypothetical protein